MNTNYGSMFCNLAYEALMREERELGILMSDNPSARPLGITLSGETTLGYLITKEAMRNPDYPQIIGEMPYETRKAVDVCFVDQDECPIASFELKLFAPPLNKRLWRDVRDDIKKHLDPRKRIKAAHENCQRYNVLFVTTATREPDDAVKSRLRTGMTDLIPDPTFVNISRIIDLSRIHTQKRHQNPYAEQWNYLRVVVFTGVCNLASTVQPVVGKAVGTL